MKVVQFYEELVKKRSEATSVVHSRVNRSWDEEEKEEFLQKRRDAKATLKKNVQTECHKAFPDIVQKSQVWKWAKQNKIENWAAIPVGDRQKWTEVPNLWRTKMGLERKGRNPGGSVPGEIQVYLDKLIAAHVMGNSDISERREVVTISDIETGTAAEHSSDVLQ